MIKQLLKFRFTGEVIGRLEYYFNRKVRSDFGGPLNGSVYRQEFFEALIQQWKATAIIETGTFRGATTEYFAKFGKQVYSIETDPRYFGYASAKLRKLSNVKVFYGDSRSHLKRIDFSSTSDRPVFYLDAHWYNDLPLAEELEIVFNKNKNSIVIVDDFKVPYDQGYTYDDYGASGALDLNLLKNLRIENLQYHFPSNASETEFGLKRGWVVISSTADALACIDQLPNVRRYQA
jgi:predicted O-methyltransferase YrrM